MPIGRFAPTPSGDLHIGNLRTALVAWLAARSTDSRFVMRIDDLDGAKSTNEIERSQLDDLAALGVDWDGEPVHQRGRRKRYDDAIESLVDAGRTYECFCSRREVREAVVAPHGKLMEGAYPGTCRGLTDSERAERRAAGRNPALRILTDHETVSFVDRVHGEQTWQIDDFVLRRNDGTPAYHVASVVDDAEIGVEEVVRGDDLLETTARHIYLADVLGLPVPEHAHVPLIVRADGTRIAKRDGPVTLHDFCEATGRRPDEVAGILAATIGLSDLDAPADSASALIEQFSFDRLDRTQWVFDPAEWVSTR